MKIVHTNDVVYRYASGDPSANGGAERYEWLLARGLASKGWLVTVGVRRGLEYQERKTINGVDFVGIGNGNIFRVWYLFLKSEKPDWWFWTGADFWLAPGVYLAKLLGIRTIFSVMHDRDVCPRKALYRRPKMWPIYALGLAGVDRIFVQHQGQFNQLSSLWQTKTTFLPGIVGQGIPCSPHSQRSCYVAWVGVFRTFKRVDLLVEIARKMPNVHFVVCGGTTTFMSPPGYGEGLVHTLSGISNIEHLGHVPPQKTLQVIAGASLLLSTSDEEGYPSVFLEAWSAGTPVVSLYIDPDEVIQQKALGVVTGSVDGAVKEISRLLDAPEEREEIGKQAREHIRAVHSVDAAVQAFESGLNLQESLCHS